MIEKIKHNICLGVLLVMSLTLLAPFVGAEYTYAAVSTNQTEEVNVKNLKQGDKFALKSGEEATYLGQLPSGRYGISATLGPIRYIPGTQTEIEAGWYWDANKKEWLSDPNMFTSSVKGRKVTITNEGKSLSWTPQLLVGGKEVKPVWDNPILLPVDPINGNYQGNTLEWDYGNGIKRHLRIIEGVQQEFFMIPSDPGKDVQVIDLGKSKDAGFSWERSPVAWDADGVFVEISPSKVVTATEFAREDIKYPITIDPTTTYTASASDGTLYKAYGYEEVAWSVAWDAVYLATTAQATYATSTSGYIGQGGAYYFGDYASTLYRGAFFFDTSSLPDSATVSSASFKMYVLAEDHDISDWSLQVQTGSATYPHDPLETADYLYSRYSGDGGSLQASSITLNQYNTLDFNATGLGYISLTGTTKFVVREDDYDIAGSEPPAPLYNDGNFTRNEIRLYLYEQGDGYWPQLEVIYTATDAPTITLNAVTDISTTTGKANAYVSSDGGEASQVTFYWDTDSGAPYSNSHTLAMNYTTGQTPSYTIPDLAVDTLHYVQVNILNTAGDNDGVETSFTTASSLNPPTYFRAIPRGSTSVSLVWTLGVGSSRTLVRYKTGAYPTSTTDGTIACNITSGSYLLEGLEPGQTIYIRTWGHDAGDFSGTYTDEMVTTYAGVVDVDTATPSIPVNFFGPAGYTGLSNLPIYDSFNNAFDGSAVERLTGWQMLLFGLAVIVGFAVFMFTKVPMAACVALLFILAYGVTVSPPLIPGVYFALVVVIVGGASFAVSKTGG